jgi:hypothetical protein
VLDKHSLRSSRAARREENGEKSDVIHLNVRRHLLVVADAFASDNGNDVQGECTPEHWLGLVNDEARRDKEELGISLGHLVIESSQGSGRIERHVCEASLDYGKNGDKEESRARNIDGYIAGLCARANLVSENIGRLVQLLKCEDEGIILDCDGAWTECYVFAKAMDEAVHDVEYCSKNTRLMTVVY